MNLPIGLTLVRILFVPFLVLFFYIPFPGNHILCAILFALAGATDWLDGYLARKHNAITKFGEFLDPVADKLMVAVALVLIVQEQNIAYITIPAAIIIGREIAISALREWMAELGKRAAVSVAFIGKVKTLAQIFSIILLLAYKPEKWLWLSVIGTILLYIAAILTLWSMICYLRAAWPEFSLYKAEKKS